MSPILYNVYVDDLTKLLCDDNIGCFIDNICVNHLMYADDSVIIVPSPSALQHLNYICEMYAKDNEISYNPKQNVCMSVLSS